MHPTPSHELLQKFIELANAKGGTFTHFTVTPNRRIRIFYRASENNETVSKNFLSYVEALEHIYITYNLKHQYHYERLEQKSLNVPRTIKERKERLFRPRPGIKFV
jgi:hypothetical protein